MFGIIIVIGLVIYTLIIVSEGNVLNEEGFSANNKKKNTSLQKTKNIPTRSKNSSFIKLENREKPATLKQKNFIKELISRNDYEVIEKILITDKLINKLTMELASNIISHILKVEKLDDNEIQTDTIFFKRFPIPHEKKKATPIKKVENKSVKLRCLGITRNKKRCARIVNYVNYFCELHSNDYKEYEFDTAIAREYFYRNHCQKFLSSLFESLTLESNENNFKLEHTIKSVIQDHLGVKEFNNFIKEFEKKSFKESFFDFTFFNVFTISLFSDYPNLRTNFRCDCSIGYFNKNNWCYDHSIYSDFHLLYEFGTADEFIEGYEDFLYAFSIADEDYFINFFVDNGEFYTGEFYLELNISVIKNRFIDLIEDYYLAIKDYNLNHPMPGEMNFD